VFGMKDLMEKAQNLQSKIGEMQEQLAGKTVTGSAGGDMVVVEITGALEVVSVRIDRGLVSEGDVEMLEDLIAGAVNAAIKKSKDMAAEELAKITGGIRLPGML
jgi:nucleoid-associated protein EbfC